MLSGFARMYGPAAALTVSAALLAWRATEKPGPKRWIAYVVAAGLAVWTDYFSAVALVGVVVAVVWLRPDRRTAAAAIGASTLAVGSIAPWLFVARAQFEHAGQGFWVPPLSPSMLGGTLFQFFAGPPIDSGVPFGPALIGLQDLAVVAGVAALGGAALAWRRLGTEGRRAAGYCLVASSGVLVLAIVSIWRPLLDARYAGVMWLPLFAVAGAGLAALPRRLAVPLLAVGAVASLALSVAITHRETSSIVPMLDREVGGHDLAAAQWDQYLVLLDESGPTVQARLHVLSATDIPWFEGTAAYPAGAVLKAIPDDVVANRGRIFWVADPGVDPPALPPGYQPESTRCAIESCLTIFGPKAKPTAAFGSATDRNGEWVRASRDCGAVASDTTRLR